MQMVFVLVLCKFGVWVCMTASEFCRLVVLGAQLVFSWLNKFAS